MARGGKTINVAIACVLRHPAVTYALVGVGSVKQLEANLASLAKTDFSIHELQQNDKILQE